MLFRASILLLSVSLSACVQRSDGRSSPLLDTGADIVVSGQGPAAPLAIGQSAEFAIKVMNAGPKDATNVRILDTIGAQSKLVSMTCTADGNATCPDPLALSMVVPKFPNGSSLNFQVKLKLADIPTGTIINSLIANYDLDGDPNNNSVAIDALVR